MMMSLYSIIWITTPPYNNKRFFWKESSREEERQQQEQTNKTRIFPESKSNTTHIQSWFVTSGVVFPWSLHFSVGLKASTIIFSKVLTLFIYLFGWHT
jgi:hypothetical protein